MKIVLLVVFPLWFLLCSASHNEHFDTYGINSSILISSENVAVSKAIIAEQNLVEGISSNNVANLSLENNTLVSLEDKDEESKSLRSFFLQVADIPPIFDSILPNMSELFHFKAFPDNRLEICGNNYFGDFEVLKFWLRVYKRLPTVEQIVIKWFFIDLSIFEEFSSFFIWFKQSLNSVTFENCNFTELSQQKICRFTTANRFKMQKDLKWLKFKILNVFKIINCSINDDTLDRIMQSLPDSLTHLYLCGIQWENEKVNLKFFSFVKFQNLIGLYLNNMKLDENDEIIRKLPDFQNLTELSLAKNNFMGEFFPDIKKMKSLEMLQIDHVLSGNLFNGNITMFSFPDSLKKICFHNQVWKHHTNRILNKFNEIVFD